MTSITMTREETIPGGKVISGVFCSLKSILADRGAHILDTATHSLHHSPPRAPYLRNGVFVSYITYSFGYIVRLGDHAYIVAIGNTSVSPHMVDLCIRTLPRVPERSSLDDTICATLAANDSFAHSPLIAYSDGCLVAHDSIADVRDIQYRPVHIPKNLFQDMHELYYCRPCAQSMIAQAYHLGIVEPLCTMIAIALEAFRGPVPTV